MGTPDRQEKEKTAVFRHPVSRCEQCIRLHHKCLPESREWPTKCERCVKRGFDCTPPVRPSEKAKAFLNNANAIVRKPKVAKGAKRAREYEDAADYTRVGSSPDAGSRGGDHGSGRSMARTKKRKVQSYADRTIPVNHDPAEKTSLAEGETRWSYKTILQDAHCIFVVTNRHILPSTNSLAGTGLLLVAKAARARQEAELAHINTIFHGLYSYLRDVLPDNEVPLDGGLTDLKTFINTFSTALHKELDGALTAIPEGEGNPFEKHFLCQALYDIDRPYQPRPAPKAVGARTETEGGGNWEAPNDRFDRCIGRFHVADDVGSSISALQERMRSRGDASIIEDLSILLKDFIATTSPLTSLFPEIVFPVPLMASPIVFSASDFIPILDNAEGAEQMKALVGMRDSVQVTLLHVLAGGEGTTRMHIKRMLGVWGGWEGANLNLKDSLGQTAFHLACARRGGNHVVRMLLKARVETNSLANFGSHPFHYACAGGDVGILDTLTEYWGPGLDVNIKDVLHRTPLFYAAVGGHVDTVKRLLGYNRVDRNCPTVTGMTPLLAAVAECKEEVVMALLEDPDVDITVRDEEGRTAIYLATLSRQGKILEKLLAMREGDPNVQAEDGSTALMCALGDEHQILRRHPGIDVGVTDNRGMTALHYAASRNSVELSRSLAMRRDGGLLRRCKSGRLPLDYAIADCKEMLQTMVEDAKKEMISFGKDFVGWKDMEGSD